MRTSAPNTAPKRSGPVLWSKKSGPVLSAGRFAPVPGDWLAYILLFVPLAGLALACRRWLLVGPLFLAVLVHPLVGRRIRLNLGILGHALVVLPVALLHRALKVNGAGGIQFNSAFYLSVLVLMVALIKLYSRPDSSRLPRMLLCGGVALTGAAVGMPDWLGTVEDWVIDSPLGDLTPAPHVFYMGLTAVYALTALITLRFIMRASQTDEEKGKGRAILYAGVGLSFAVAVLLAIGGILPFRAHWEDISQFYLKLSRGLGFRTSGAFSDQALLGSVINMQQEGGRTVALRAFSRKPPGYLRGKVFHTYGRGKWIAQKEGLRFQVLEARYQFPAGRVPTPGEAPVLNIHPSSTYGAHFFLPLETCTVGTGCETVLIFPGNTLRSGSAPTSRGYDVYLDGEPIRAEADADEYLGLPGDADLLGALDNLITSLKLRSMRRNLAVKSIASYFQANYRYHLGIRFHSRSDPLTQFLREKRHGHCELFASAGTLLLRRLGVRARYVTGFVCEEKNAYAEDLWIARNRYAHAWIEYYDPVRGWQTAEFTPSDGIPAPEPSAGVEAFLDWLRGGWERFLGRFRHGLKGLPDAIIDLLKGTALWLVAKWWRIGLLIGCIGGFLLWRFRPRSRKRKRTRAPRLFPTELAEARERYLAMEATLARAGLGRRPWETLLEYGDRLREKPFPDGLDRQECLAFLRTFAHHRYGPEAEIRRG
jgi:hypothetical protein